MSAKEREISRKLVKILDKLLSKGDWGSSPLLRTTKKKFQNYKDEAESLAAEPEVAEEALVNHRVPEGYRKVFISLYQSEGRNLQLWQNMLKSLARFSISRPVYDNEDYVQEVIRSKPEPVRHAYAVVVVREDDIIQNGRVKTDPLGHELIVLRERAVELRNILEFVHANKKHYHYIRGVLTLA